MNSQAVRRGWCPSVLQPMPTGDGLLVRLHRPGGVLTRGQARAVARTATLCGNGLIDVTARGNLQIRGLSEATHPRLVDQLSEAGLIDEAGGAGVTIVAPLAGLDPTDLVDARALAVAVEREARRMSGLPPKLAIAIDGGGRWPLDSVNADLRLVAVPASIRSRLAIGLAGGDSTAWFGTAPADEAPSAIARILAAFAEHRQRHQAASRIRDLLPEERSHLIQAARLDPPCAPTDRPSAPRVGVLDVSGDSTALLVALPFGACPARLFEDLADWSDASGNGEVRLSPWRGIALPGLSRFDALALRMKAGAAGLIVDPADPRLAVAACPGSPACASATTPTREDAARIAISARRLIAAGATLHVSGCAKGCAHPRAADMTLVGDSGAYRVVVNGSARDVGGARLSLNAVSRRLERARSVEALKHDLAEAAA